jgi:hypothetical protein
MIGIFGVEESDGRIKFAVIGSAEVGEQISIEVRRAEIPTNTRELKRQLKLKATNPEKYEKIKNKLI